MQVKALAVALLSLGIVAEASVLHGFPGFLAMRDRRQVRGGRNGNQIQNGNNDNNNNNVNNNGSQGQDAATNTCLSPDAVQTGSASDGQQDGAVAGQSPSETSTNNFINFCAGKLLTNGLQTTGGSCNGIVMGDIPSQDKMISSMLVSPAHNDQLAANQDFDIQVQISNLDAGTFTNPQNTYYAAPQQLNGQGQVIGHTHVVIQDMGNSLTPTQALDASTFVFFKGINDNGNGNGLLSATVTGGLPAGNYRVCTMSGASNHQPPLMPVAQRGAQEDCNKFAVGDAGNNANSNNNIGSNGNNTGNNRNSGKNSKNNANIDNNANDNTATDNNNNISNGDANNNNASDINSNNGDNKANSNANNNNNNDNNITDNSANINGNNNTDNNANNNENTNGITNNIINDNNINNNSQASQPQSNAQASQADQSQASQATQRAQGKSNKGQQTQTADAGRRRSINACHGQ